MDKDKIERLIEVHKDKTTQELKAIASLNDNEEWDEEALEAMRQILESRGVDLGEMFSESTEKRLAHSRGKRRRGWQDPMIVIPIILLGLSILLFNSCKDAGIIWLFPLSVGLICLRWIWMLIRA